MTRKRLDNINDTDEAMTLTVIDLSKSSILSRILVLRDSLQSDIGELKNKSNGSSVTQLCAQTRKIVN